MTDFLLLHGVNATADEWERIIPALQADQRVGKIVAPDMPGRAGNRPGEYDIIRLTDYLATAVESLRRYDLRDVVMVGHSGGGIYMQAVAAAEPNRMRRMVFLSAFISKPGRSFLDLQPLPFRLLARCATGIFRARQNGFTPFTLYVRWALGHDLLPEDRARIPTFIVPEPLAMMVDSLDWPVERVRAPATYICTTRDRVNRPKNQLRMARELLGAEIIELPVGHAYPVMYPQRLVEILLGYAQHRADRGVPATNE